MIIDCLFAPAVDKTLTEFALGISVVVWCHHSSPDAENLKNRLICVFEQKGAFTQSVLPLGNIHYIKHEFILYRFHIKY